VHAPTTGRDTPRGASRRLSRRVLVPLVACGLALVCGTTTAATLVAREAAVRGVDARAEALHTLTASSLARTGHVGPATAAARASGGSLRTSPADQPLPGGRSVHSDSGRRIYDYNVRDERVTIALPAGSVAHATLRALVLTGGGGLALLLITLLAVQSVLRRAAIRPLRGLAAAVELLAAGEPVKVPDTANTREVTAVRSRLSALAARLAELEAQATTDPLTGVANRRSFQAALDCELKRAVRDGRSLTLVMIDLDGFKAINDTHGHPFGDGVLQIVAENMREGMRATDIVARVGGDEFAILLPATDVEGAEALVERARTAAAGAIGGVVLTWSAGIAAFPADARDAETLVECADVALYCAKATGESTVCRYDPEQSQVPASGGDHAAVEMLLSMPDGIVPVYQPLISLATGQIAGYEALARFPHPPARRPDEWFAIATCCGLGHELERKAMKAALASHSRPSGTYLSFNLSASALTSDEILSALPEDLSEIVIEITENERVTEGETLAGRLQPLRERGARIAVDDAGAGYSGLQQVMRIQPDMIKLDRSLVANVDSDPAKAALIDSFVRFAARSGSAVCAEGIETPEELKVLADLDVTYGQGFGIARPAAPWVSVAPWIAGTIGTRAARAENAAVAANGSGERSDRRLTALTARLAKVRSHDELRGLAALMASEMAADEVALLHRGSDPGTLDAVTDHLWLPAGSPLALSYYPTLREVLASQEVFQVQDSDASADLGELTLLARSTHRSMLIAPIVANGEVIGLMIAFGDAARPWTRAETSRARVVGHELGVVIEALAEPRALV
jgi:diguanylate cyclase (GGDEF)-like protein